MVGNRRLITEGSSVIESTGSNKNIASLTEFLK